MGGCFDLSSLFISRALLQMDAHPGQAQQSFNDTVRSSVQALTKDPECLQHGLVAAHETIAARLENTHCKMFRSGR